MVKFKGQQVNNKRSEADFVGICSIHEMEDTFLFLYFRQQLLWEDEKRRLPGI